MVRVGLPYRVTDQVVVGLPVVKAPETDGHAQGPASREDRNNEHQKFHARLVEIHEVESPVLHGRAW